MANWTPEKQPFGANHAPLLTGLASDGISGPVPVAVDPATGRLLVNSTGSTASSVAINDGVTTTRKATVANLTNANPLAVEIVDGSGNQVTSFGGGTQYTDAGTPPAHPVGPTLEFNNAGTWATVGSATPLPITIAGGLSNPLPVSGTVTANPTTPTIVRYGQSTVAVTNTAVQLTNQAVTGVVVQALAANAGNVVVGDASVTTGNGFQLQPGQATGVAIDNLNRLYVNGTSGDGVCWIGS